MEVRAGKLYFKCGDLLNCILLIGGLKMNENAAERRGRQVQQRVRFDVDPLGEVNYWRVEI